LKGTQGIENNKVVKWIIEVAALNDKQIIQLTALIKCCVSNFKELNFASVFVKSSTGFYITENNLPMEQPFDYFDVRKCNTTSCKAAGGVRDL
jgi:deoxyribose-phosphate aldolase